MTDDFPLLDLESAWKDAHALLHEVIAQADQLWEESEQTWHAMMRVGMRARQALAALGDLPSAVQEAIAQDRAELQEWEDRANA